jgi:hypothetical protein
MEKSFEPSYYMQAPVSSASILREQNIPFEVIGTKNIRNDPAKVLILSHVANIREEEMDEIEAYLKKGGNLYISGPIGNPRLEKLLGVRTTGRTPHDFTYMSPTEEGASLFEGFTRQTPLTIDMHQTKLEILDNEDVTVLATRTLPYTMTNTSDFSAIHSNPPGIYTDEPCVIEKVVGESRIIWSAAPIEMSRPYMSRQVFARIIRRLVKEPSFTSNAPKYVEVLGWQKDSYDYFAVINEQEEPPVVPVYEITIDINGRSGGQAYLLPEHQALDCEQIDDHTLRIHVPKLEIFHILRLEYAEDKEE